MQYKSKSEFPKDKESGKTILGSAEAMKAWVALGFEEQKIHQIQGLPFTPYIDLRNCILYVSYPIGQSQTTSQIFNFCDVAGIIPGTEKLANDPDGFLFQVNLQILFNGSILKGAFFHYVHFKERVDLSDTTIYTSSCFKCKFDKGIFGQKAIVGDSLSWDQCEFEDSVYFSLTDFNVLTFCIRECNFKDELNLSSITLNAPSIENHPLHFCKTDIRNLIFNNLQGVNRDICLSNCKVENITISNPIFNYSLYILSTELSGIGLICCREFSPLIKHTIKELTIDRCTIINQIHIEQVNIPSLTIRFCSIAENALLRISDCASVEMIANECIVSGSIELKRNKIENLFLDLVLFGHVIFKKNAVEKYLSRDTVRLLKHEALECNDRVSAIEFDKIEKIILKKEPEWKDMPFSDKTLIYLDKLTNYFGNNWIRPFSGMIISVLFLTSLFFACSSYNHIDFSEAGFNRFMHGYLSNIDVFSITDFDKVTETYKLTICGQIIWLFTKLIVVYLAYQCLVAFRKFNRNF